MYYESQLQFLLGTLRKCRLQVLLLRTEDITAPQADLAMRRQLGWEQDDSFFSDYLLNAQPNTIYRLADPFLCHYLFLRLPQDGRLLFIGPYLTEELTHNQLLEHSEKHGLLPQQFRRLEAYYSSLPIIGSNHTVFAMLDTFGETIWGGETAFSVSDINRELSGDRPPLIAAQATDTLTQDMAVLESRYAYENAIIQAVSQGLTHKAELLFSGFPDVAFEQRLSDPIRNLKNYSIIMNTLLRKAAESGGVHPLYIDRTSTEFARRIELLTAPSDVRELMTDMFRTYCRLVKSHAIKHYSPPVQKVITTIDTDPAADLRLSTLAEQQDLNASYLSALFRRETGETVTQHVNRKRISMAVHLLSTTHLQVQTVAQLCGIPDVNYFAKLFKKHTGKAPRAYRENSK